MRSWKIAVGSVGFWILTAAAASADVQLSIANGRVTLVAKDATVRQILAEWARVGQTRIVNADRVGGGPVTLELHGVPEAQALDTILRSVSGYMAAPRQAPIANASVFDRIIVMPTSVAPPAMPVRTAAQPQPPMFPQPRFQPGIAQPGAAGDEDAEEERAPRNPVFNAFPPPQIAGQPQQPSTVAPAQGPLVLPQPGGQTGNSSVIGVATPGTIVQPPTAQEPGQPVIPGQPRRPGGGLR